jgi:hypothetical protein
MLILFLINVANKYIMKKIFSIIIIQTCIASISIAQQNALYLQTGAAMHVTGSPTITLQNMDWQNNGTFNADQSNVYFTGNTKSKIGGSAKTAFYNIRFQSTDTIMLTGDIYVGNGAYMNGMVNVNNHTAEFAPLWAQIISEDENKRFVDNVANTGNVYTQVGLNFQTNLLNLNGLGAYITSTVNLGNTIVRRYCVAFNNNGNSTGLIHRYYDIQPTVNSFLGASLRLKYFDAELNGVNENNAVIWKSSNNGITWTQLAPDARDVNANWVQKDNVDDFSLWTIGDANISLPIIVKGFNNSCTANGANLVWKTELESGLQHFIIEKSMDGQQWQAIGSIDPKGNGSSYTFNDVQNGLAYYRLAWKDALHVTQYSTVLKSNCHVASVSLFIYPNPTVSFANLVFTSTEQHKAQILVYNQAGQLVKTMHTSVVAGTNTIRVNVFDLPKGTYIIRLHANDINISKQIIVQ